VKNAYVQFANLLHKFYAEQPAASAEIDATLSFAYEAEQAGNPLRVTDLVRAERFGTLPTVNRRLKDMVARGLIEMPAGADRRTRLIRVLPAGERLLENRAALLREAHASEVRRAASAASKVSRGAAEK